MPMRSAPATRSTPSQVLVQSLLKSLPQIVLLGCLALAPVGCGNEVTAPSETDGESTLPPPVPKPRLLIPELQEKPGPDTPLFKGGGALNNEMLGQALARALARPEMEGIRVGLHVVDAISGEEIISRNADETFVPASNVKLITTAMALKLLGPSYRFETELLSTAKIDGKGSLEGDLVIRGGGDPYLGPEQLAGFADELHSHGLRHISGNILIDEGYFDDKREGAGWEQDDTDNSYQAPMGAMSVNFNSITIYISPGALNAPPLVSILPQSSYLKIDNKALTTDVGRTLLIVHTPRSGEGNTLKIGGRIHPEASRRVFWRKIDNPPLFAGMTLRDAFDRAGIITDGTVKIGSAPKEAVRLFAYHSPPLWRIVTMINKISNNHATEQIVKSMGAVKKGSPGSWDKGLAVLRELILEQLEYKADTYVLNNGSGLGDVNRIPPRLFTRLLTRMLRDPDSGPEFVASLAIAGRDGTLLEYFNGGGEADLLRAKTGSLEQVIALSGYLMTRAGQTLALSLIMNECRGHNRLRLLDIQKEFVIMLANFAPNGKSDDKLNIDEN